jgi:hypothetical protein
MDRKVAGQLLPAEASEHLGEAQGGDGVDVSYSCPILQQLMSNLISRWAAGLAIHRIACGGSPLSSGIWTSIADKECFWTRIANTFSAR